MNQNVMDKLATVADKLRRRYTVSRIGVFGSHARGDHNGASDVDVLVEFAEPTFDNYMDLKFELEELFQRPVDLVMADSVKPRLRSIIAKEVIYAEG